MQEANDSPFMNLPTELRCLIYSYLPAITYSPVFSSPHICNWEVYQLPTALLRLNKTIYSEVKHPSIQAPLQKINNRLLPKIVLGPTRTDIDAVYIVLSDTFHRAGKKLYTFLGGPRKRGDEVHDVSLEIASWYNDTFLPQQVPDAHEEAFGIQNECRPEHLYKFVRQTLKRMGARKTCEIRVRLLAHPMRPLHWRGGDGSRYLDWTYRDYERRAAYDINRRGLSPGMCRELKIVYVLRRGEGFLAPVYDCFWNFRLDIKVVKARERDMGLFDVAMGLC